MFHAVLTAIAHLEPRLDNAQELRIWQTRLDISAVRTRGAIAATQDMLAAETARARTDIAAICDKSDRSVIKGGAAPADQLSCLYDSLVVHSKGTTALQRCCDISHNTPQPYCELSHPWKRAAAKAAAAKAKGQ